MSDNLVDEHKGFSLHGIKLVLDCANGAASWYAPEVFSRLGADVCGHPCVSHRFKHQ